MIETTQSRQQRRILVLVRSTAGTGDRSREPMSKLCRRSSQPTRRCRGTGQTVLRGRGPRWRAQARRRGRGGHRLTSLVFSRCPCPPEDGVEWVEWVECSCGKWFGKKYSSALLSMTPSDTAASLQGWKSATEGEGQPRVGFIVYVTVRLCETHDWSDGESP